MAIPALLCLGATAGKTSSALATATHTLPHSLPGKTEKYRFFAQVLAFYGRKFFQVLIPDLIPPASDPFPTYSPPTLRLWTQKVWAQPIIILDPTALWWSGYWTSSCWVEHTLLLCASLPAPVHLHSAHNPQYEAQSSDPQDTRYSVPWSSPSEHLSQSVYMG